MKNKIVIPGKLYKTLHPTFYLGVPPTATGVSIPQGAYVLCVRQATTEDYGDGSHGLCIVLYDKSLAVMWNIALEDLPNEE